MPKQISIVLKFHFVLPLLSLLFPSFLKANKVTQNLFINRGVFTTVKNTIFPYFAFNSTTTFTSLNTVISILKTDTLIINVTNNDTVIHGFNVKNYTGASFTITPASSISTTIIPTQQSVFIYYDHLIYPRNTYMGLAGMIVLW